MTTPAQSASPRQLFEMLCEEFRQRGSRFTTDPADFTTTPAILALSNEQRVEIVRLLVHAIHASFSSLLISVKHAKPSMPRENLMTASYVSRALVASLLRKPLPLTDDDCRSLVSCQLISDAAVITAVERLAATATLSDGLRKCLQDRKVYLQHEGAAGLGLPPSKKNRQFMARIDALLGGPVPPTGLPQYLDLTEPWAVAAQRDILAFDHPTRAAWDALLFHLQTADGSKPSQKWLKQATALLDAFGRDRFRICLLAWLPLTLQKRTTDQPPRDAFSADPSLVFTEKSETTLKGIAWAASLLNDPEITATLGDLGESCWKKVVWHGPRSKLIGNAVLWALSDMGGRGNSAAVAQLTRINSKLKHASARKLADKAMNRAADAAGQTRDDLEELAVPTFDLDANTSRTQSINTFTCTLSLTPALEPEITITVADGKIRKSVPADLKSDPTFKSLQKNAKELAAVLAGQRSRIEAILRDADRTWTFREWKQRYLEHPLLALFGRRLIWRFTTSAGTVAALPLQGRLTQSNDALFTCPDDARVKLWHPSTASPEEVRAWRDFLIRHQVTQPFKQAHREIYLLTDAERTTATYSNRFAAHIIRQHQFQALCSARGWKYKLQGSWDGFNIPTLDLPALGYQASFLVEQSEAAQPATATGVSVYLSTDQVRFTLLQAQLSTREANRRFLQHYQDVQAARAADREEPPPLELDNNGPPLALAEIPPQLFSEVMRDVDLFVSVCSVGNDPQWQDGDPGGRTYWHDISFGDLSASAQTRRDVLEHLLPRLAIASQCTLTDKFLIIKGSLRTYKIHLGSSNILMEPNAQYLCIVPNRAAPDVFLPFEGDHTLSVILSKAFLLANDRKITDPTITRQITPP